MQIILSLIFVLVFTGCASKKLNDKYSDNSIKKFTQVAIIEPSSSIYQVGKNEEKKDDETSELIRGEFKNQVNRFIGKTNSAYYDKSIFNAADFDSIFSILNEAFSGDVSQIKIIGKENIFNKIKEDKIVINYIKGFHKTKSRIRGETTKSILIGIVTLGMMVPVYLAYSTTFYSVMIDKTNGDVIYRELITAGRDPRDTETTEYFVNKSVTKYFDLEQ